MVESISLLILEDDPILCNSLEILFSGEQSFSVVKSAKSAHEALNIIQSFSPDVILVDLGLPDMSGCEFIRICKSKYPQIELMAYTVYDDKERVLSALKAGATGYVLKGCTPRELIEAVITLYKGGAPMSPKIARALVREFQECKDKNTGEPLTYREKAVLKELEQGATYKEIASNLKISYHTVHTHIKRIYEKLHAHGKREALKKAKIKGLI